MSFQTRYIEQDLFHSFCPIRCFPSYPWGERHRRMILSILQGTVSSASLSREEGKTWFSLNIKGKAKGITQRKLLSWEEETKYKGPKNRSSLTMIRLAIRRHRLCSNEQALKAIVKFLEFWWSCRQHPNPKTHRRPHTTKRQNPHNGRSYRYSIHKKAKCQRRKKNEWQVITSYAGTEPITIPASN